MSIEFVCPHCEYLLRTAEDKAGMSAECPACGDALWIPYPEELSSPDDPAAAVDEEAWEHATTVDDPPGSPLHGRYADAHHDEDWAVPIDSEQVEDVAEEQFDAPRDSMPRPTATEWYHDGELWQPRLVDPGEILTRTLELFGKNFGLLVTAGAVELVIGIVAVVVVAVPALLAAAMVRLETKSLEPEDTVSLMKSITPERNQQELQEVGGTDFGFAFGDKARFRVAVFKQRGHIGMVLRRIPNDPGGLLRRKFRYQYQRLGKDQDGNDVMLADIWPTNEEVRQHRVANIDRQMFETRYADVYKGDEDWQAINVEASDTYNWNPSSTYVANPPYFEGMGMEPAPVEDIVGAKPLAVLGDSVTTDHISPAGSIKEDSPAGEYLISHQVAKKDFNSYGSRRGNHDVMMRGTFANIRIRNEMVPGVEGGYTTYKGEQMAIYDAAMKHKEDGTPLVVVAGKEYGTGSSRDWAAKGTILLGVRAVIVESYERIHRSNLIGMGVLPLQFKDGDTRETLGLTGECSFTIKGLDNLSPRQDVEVEVTREDGTTFTFTALCRIDTANEMEYYRNGGILHYVLRKLAAA